MRKGKNVIGKEVLSYVDGEKSTSVKDLIIGLDNSSIVALLVDEGGLFSTARVVPMENVVSFGKDAVVISDTNSIVPADAYPAVSEILDRKDKLLGKKVFTEGGDEEGSVSDIYFEEGTGEIFGYEVSGGMLNNVAKGSSYLPLEDIINIGPDLILIKSEAVYDMDAQVGGVQGALETAKDKVGGAVDTAKEKAGEAASNIGEAAKDKQIAFLEGKTVSQAVTDNSGNVIVSEGQVITRSLAERAERQGKLGALVAAAGGSMLSGVASKMEQTGENAAIGKRVGKDVEADDGSIIVANGQRVRQQQVELARSKGKLPDLLAAAGLGQAQQAGSGAGDAMGEAGDKAGQVAGQATEKAGDLWDNFTRKIGEVTDSAGKRVDEEKTKKRLSDIQDAVGRPVSKVILDKQDNVVLNLGDIITHDAVQRAYDAGMLDSLLGNVYKGDVEFSKEEMRAQTEGEATIEKASGDAPVVQELEQKVEQAEQEREEGKEQKREEAEQKREQRSEEREASKTEREEKPQARQEKEEGDSDKSSGDNKRDNASAGDATEKHTQATISDEQFESGGKQSK